MQNGILVKCALSVAGSGAEASQGPYRAVPSQFRIILIVLVSIKISIFVTNLNTTSGGKSSII